jgi:hypothetical protein
MGWWYRFSPSKSALCLRRSNRGQTCYSSAIASLSAITCQDCAELAVAREVSVKYDTIFAGGASLRAHWNAGHAAQAIASGGYDYVVLQEQSTLPIKNASRMAENVRLFDEAIKRADSKTVLYMTWARQHSPESQHAITTAYNSIGVELGAIVVPVGLVWQHFLSEHDEPVLYDRDQSHPSLAGTYLAACVFLAALLKTNR